MTEQFIIVLGTPIDGLLFLGPFPSAKGAEAWAEMQNYETEWWVAPLTRPLATITDRRGGTPPAGASAAR